MHTHNRPPGKLIYKLLWLLIAALLLLALSLALRPFPGAQVAASDAAAPDFERPGGLGNDSDPDGDAQAAVLDSDSAHSTLALNPDGSFVYTPAAGFSGRDSFSYHASDGLVDSNAATVSVEVTFCADVSEIPQAECEALKALYTSTNGDNWFNNDGWLLTNTPCSWRGVTCDSGHVTQLDLHDNRLTGSIPPELGNLASLQWLYLENNQLTGGIPPAMSHSPLLAPNQCAPPPSNIVAWWPLDEQAGAIAADIIGSNDGAHQNGPTPVPGMVDYALSFDGVDDNVVVNDDPALDFGTGDFSLEAWIEGTRSTANIVSKRTSHGNPGYLLMLYSGHLLLQMSDDVDGWYNFYSPDTPNLADGNWHHVAVTVDRDDPEGGRMYADGEPIYTFNPTRRSGNMDSPAPFWIGVEDGTGNYFTGKIDEVSLYKRALTATEVQAIFNADSSGKCKTPHNAPPEALNQCAPPPSNIVAWWPFDEQTGAIAADIIGANDGAHENGLTPVPGMVDYALSFDGVDDYVVVDDDPALDFGTGDFSIETWIQSDGTTPYDNIISKKTSILADPGYLLMLYGGRLLLQMSDDVDGWYNFYSPDTPNLADGNWRHVAVTVDRDDPEGGRMYADGSLIYTFDPTWRSGNMDISAPFRIGVEDNGASGKNFWWGKIDEVSLYKRALTTAEVQAIFNAGSSGKCKTPHNAPPLAIGDAYTTTEDAPLVVAAPGVLENDEDADGDTLTAVLDSEPMSGTLALAADGSFIYTPTTNFAGLVTFTYHAFDGELDSNVVTVTVETVAVAASLSGLIWEDLNTNAVRDRGEWGTPAVVIELKDGADSLIATETTMADGAYRFDHLPPGDYVVDIDESTLRPGMDLVAGNEPLTVTLASGQHHDQANFGYARPLLYLNAATSATSTQPGASVTYTLVLTATHDAATATLTDTLPAGMTYVTDSVTGGAVYTAGRILYTGVVTPGSEVVLTYRATVDGDVTPGSILRNTAVVTGAGYLMERSAPVAVPDSQFSGTLVLIYANGDNNLANAMLRLLNSAEQTANNPQARILLLLDGPGAGDSYLYRLQQDQDDSCPDYNNPTCAGRYVLGQTLWPVGESVSTADSLADFLKGALWAYPEASQVALALVGHGGGWSPEVLAINPFTYEEQPGEDPLGGLLWDVHPGNALSTLELGRALRRSHQASGRPIDLLYLDACLMAMAEVAYEVSNDVGYFLASENWSWAAFPYNDHVGDVQDGMDAAAIGAAWLENQAQALRPEGYPFTLSLADLSRMNDLKTATDGLAIALMAELPERRLDIGTAFGNTLVSGGCFDSSQEGAIDEHDNYCDLGLFAHQIELQFSATVTVATAAQSVQDVITNMVVAEDHEGGAPWTFRSQSWNWGDLDGLSIYLPLGVDNWKRRYYGSDYLRWAQDSHWDEFLVSYWGLAEPPNDPDCQSPECDPPRGPLPLPPRILLITRSGISGVSLIWSSFNFPLVDHYEIWRSGQPYFDPDDPDDSATLVVTTTLSSYTDLGIIDDVDSNHFYVVRPIGESIEPRLSNQVGEFDFALWSGD